MSEISISGDVRELIEESVAWRMFSLAFERPRNGWRDHVDAIAHDANDDTVRAIALMAQEQADEALFLEVFGPGGAVSPREVAYRGFADPGHVLAELEAIYHAFAYEPASEECPDHVSVEAGFVGYLRMKQAFARIVGDEEAERLSAEASAMFIKEHLGAIAAGLAKRFDDDDSFYIASAAKLMRETIGDVEIREEVAPPDDDGEMSCAGGCPVGET
ncbi:MAG: molecular chaperone TorD family protein [Acidobacteria bacterium]|nr:molecular chaperone TorD family protein [Acidobacteriota bacterium]